MITASNLIFRTLRPISFACTWKVFHRVGFFFLFFLSLPVLSLLCGAPSVAIMVHSSSSSQWRRKARIPEKFSLSLMSCCPTSLSLSTIWQISFFFFFLLSHSGHLSGKIQPLFKRKRCWRLEIKTRTVSVFGDQFWFKFCFCFFSICANF